MINEVRIDAKITALAVNKIFEQRHFSICDFDKLVEMRRLIVPKETHIRLRALHCIDWADMDAEIRAWVYETVVTLVQLPPEFPKLGVAPVFEPGNFSVPKPVSMGQRLLGAFAGRKKVSNG